MQITTPFSGENCDAGSGDDREDPAWLFRAEEADQGDQSRPEESGFDGQLSSPDAGSNSNPGRTLGTSNLGESAIGHAG